MNKDQVKGTVKEAVGKVESETGKLTGSTEHRLKGDAKQVEGKVQKTVGDIREAAKDANRRP